MRDHIERGLSFAVETTLRTAAAIEQAELARKRGFATHLRFIATDSAACVMSNHHHLVVTDTRGVLPGPVLPVTIW